MLHYFILYVYVEVEVERRNCNNKIKKRKAARRGGEEGVWKLYLLYHMINDS